MKKIDDFSACLEALKTADFARAAEDAIYQRGILGQYSLTFDHAVNALQAVLPLHNVSGAETGSPLAVLKLAYRAGFISDPEVWLLMQRKNELVSCVYSEDEIATFVILIRDSFIPALEKLRDTLIRAEREAQSGNWD